MRLVSAILLVSAIGFGGLREPKTIKTPETLAQVMLSIHRDLLQARHQFSWLEKYTDQCHSDHPSMIFYMPHIPRRVEGQPLPQKLDQMGFSFIPWKSTKRFKYESLFDRTPQCA